MLQHCSPQLNSFPPPPPPKKKVIDDTLGKHVESEGSAIIVSCLEVSLYISWSQNILK